MACAFAPLLTPLLPSGISVGFNFLGRDFFNAISEKARITAPHAAKAHS
jgi:hypothetical protein